MRTGIVAPAGGLTAGCEGAGSEPEMPRKSARLSLGRISPRARAGISLVVLVALAAAANIWWVVSYRRGLPVNIDEAGYLEYGVHFANEISQHGLAGLVAAWQQPSISGPLLPLLAGIVRVITGVGPLGMMLTQQVFYGLVIVASYFLARRLTSRPWSLVIALVVACLPGIIDSGRLFLLAEPAAALFTLVLVAQLRCGSFDSLWRCLIWGVVVGLAVLTRTMVLGIIVGPVAAAALRALGSGLTRRRFAHLCAGAATTLVVAGSWYWTSWRTVWSYLTSYGYGSGAGDYGHRYSVLSWGWWTTRINDIVNQDLYLPALLVLLLGVVVVAAVALARRVAAGEKSSPGSASGQPGAARVSRPSRWARRSWPAVAREALASDPGTIAVALAVAWLVLSTTQNSGSFFELPLVPALVCLVLAPVGSRPAAAMAVVGSAALVASGLALLDQGDLIPAAARYSTLSAEPINVTVLNSSEAGLSGPLLGPVQVGGLFWSNCGGATISCFYGRRSDLTVRYFKSWDPLSAELEHFVYRFAGEHGYRPVVFFAYQGPFLNTNTVGLDASLEGRSLPIGALVAPKWRGGLKMVAQLQKPALGEPNIVVAGVLTSRLGPLPGRESPPSRLEEVDKVLRLDGFSLVKTIPLPSAYPLGIWWKDR